jgi:hypothetical protein
MKGHPEGKGREGRKEQCTQMKVGQRKKAEVPRARAKSSGSNDTAEMVKPQVQADKSAKSLKRSGSTDASDATVRTSSKIANVSLQTSHQKMQRALSQRHILLALTTLM